MLVRWSVRWLTTWTREVVQKFLADTEATEQFGRQLAAFLLARTEPVVSVWLEGDLGAGKTCLTRSCLRAMGHNGAVKSPTYTLVEPYNIAGRTIYHFDLYRLADPEELEFLGIRDYFASGDICIIEWPQRAGTLLPPPDLRLQLLREQQGRRLLIEAMTERAHNWPAVLAG